MSIPIHFKPGVVAYNMHDRTGEILAAAQKAYRMAGLTYVTVTSMREGLHSVPMSAHYDGRAIDFRTRFDDSTVQFSNEIKKEIQAILIHELGDKFYVRIEALHIHVHLKDE